MKRRLACILLAALLLLGLCCTAFAEAPAATEAQLWNITDTVGPLTSDEDLTLEAQAEEISRTVLELERKMSGSDDNSNAVIEHFKSYAVITALTREISIDLLHSVTIYPDGRMDIRLNLVDEIEALMETLRESCTA